MALKKINAKINVKALNKNKLYVGEKGTYANITLIETPGGQYGDWMIIEDLSKEERQNDPGKKATILGNGKNYGWKSSDVSSTQAPPVSSDDLPY